MIDQLHIKYDPNKYINQVPNFLTKTNGLAKGKNNVIKGLPPTLGQNSLLKSKFLPPKKKKLTRVTTSNSDLLT